MRRNDKEIKDRAEIDAIIRHCRLCRLGLCDDGEPYVVPLNFGYDGDTLYFHCAPEGRKLDILRRNNHVCVEFDIPGRMIEDKQACDWGMKFQSVMIFGKAEILEGLQDKRHGLAALMAQYSDKTFSFPDAAVHRVCVIRVMVDRVSGKQSVDVRAVVSPGTNSGALGANMRE